MTEDIKGLIEKIQEEGVVAAEQRAKGIEEEARRLADEIVAKAKAEAQKIIANSNDSTKKMEAGARASLKQAARDTVLELKGEIHAILDKVMATSLRQALSPQELGKIIHSIIKERVGKGPHDDIIVFMKKEDLVALEEGLRQELEGQLRKGIILKPSEDIQGGFIISFDAGKSHFDFTDKALAEYLGTCLRPKLKSFLEDV